MAKMHFKALAEALKRERPGENWDANKRVQWNLDVGAVAGVCGDFNNRFHYHEFIDACGGLFDV